MDIARLMRLRMTRIEDEHIVKPLRALAAVLEHRAHRGVAVDVRVFALYVVVLGRFECEIFVYLHKLGIHLADSRTLSPV